MSLLDKSQLNYIGGVSQLTDVNMIKNQCKEQNNSIISIKSGGIRKRNSLELFGDLADKYIKSNAYMYSIDRTDNEKYVIVISDNGEVLAFDKEGNSFPVIMNDTDSMTYLICPDPKTQLKHVVVNDTTYIVNKTVTTAMADNLSPTHYNQALIWLKNVAYGKTYEIIINGNTVATHTTPDGSDPSHVELTTTDVVADGLKMQLDSIKDGINFNFDIVNGSVILASHNDLNASWTLETKDGKGGQDLVNIKGQIRNDAELPSQAFQNFVVKVDGDPLTSEGDYFYKFEVDGNAIRGEGTWVETLDENIKYKLAQYSMPQKLVSYPDRFELVPVEWFDRLVGDEETNPVATFVDKRINDIFLFSNRIGFLSGDSIILSEHDVYTNFFKSSIRATLETDYIDVTASTTELNILQNAIVFNNELVVNSNKNFFSLGFQGNNIANSNATLRNFGSYETSPNLRPVKKGTSIYYINDVNENSRLYEMYVNNYNSADIKEASFMVPEYMPSNLDIFFCKPDNNIFLMNKSGDRDIYVFQEVKQNGQALISAFHKWSLAEGIEVIGVTDLGNKLIFLANYKGFTRLYSISLSETYHDDGFSYHNHLDYKQNETNITNIDFNSVSKKTEITLSNVLNADLLTVVITEDIGDLVRGETLYCTGTNGFGTYYFNKDIVGSKFIIGERYEQSLTHSTFYSPNRDGTNRTEGTTQLSTQELFFDDSGYLEVDVIYKNRNNRTQTIKQGIVGFGVNGSDKLDEQNLFTGSKRFGITNKNTDTDIRVRNISHLPLNLIKCSYVFRYWGRTNGL